MIPSVFTLRVPLRESNDVFLMNTLSDAQVIVSSDVVGLLDRLPQQTEFSKDEQEAIALLSDQGFLVPDRETDHRLVEEFFQRVYNDTTQLRVTVLTTLQCNFACDYCYQGDHGDVDRAPKMSLETAGRVVQWIEKRLDEVRPRELALTFFGGEPLLNLPVLYDMSERLWRQTRARGVTMSVNIITNGLLLSAEIVDRLIPYGLNGIKVTLDGDRDTHDRMRPRRGGQRTFDRIISNIRAVAGKCRIAIGGNFDESSVHSFPALLDFLKEQEFADKLVKVAFKPIVRTGVQAPSHGYGDPRRSPTGEVGVTPRVNNYQKRVISLRAVEDNRKPLNGTCMTAVGAGNTSPCDSCHFVDDQMSFLREETRKRGFPTLDGVHMGPCEIHKRHAHTIGPDGSLYACPGFTGDLAFAVGRVDEDDDLHQERRPRFAPPSAWKTCGDCGFIPVCAGGCSVASHTELGDVNAPTCHKPAFESALVALAADAARAS